MRLSNISLQNPSLLDQGGPIASQWMQSQGNNASVPNASQVNLDMLRLRNLAVTQVLKSKDASGVKKTNGTEENGRGNVTAPLIPVESSILQSPIVPD
ncbi:MAG: hypothetical protein Tsb002_36000 [Wenzhouxiangellaceae bacterium]